MADDLGGFVVEVGLEKAERLGDEAGFGGGCRVACGLSEKNPENVGNGEVPGAGTVAEAPQDHRGNRSEAVRDFREDGRTGGCDELGIDGGARQRAVAHEGKGRRGGEGDLAVCAGHKAASDGKG